MSQIAGPPLRPSPPLSPPPSPSIAARRAWHRRPALIIPVALVLIAVVAAALFLVLKPVRITASGVVLDRLTGRPVASARLQADGKSARTNARGAFRIPGLPPGTRVRIQARYYATAKVTTVSTPLKVRLAPVPVHVTSITSTLTGRSLAALVTPPDGSPARAAADGTLTLYLASPGQSLTATAAGYLPGRAVIGRDDTASLTLNPTQPTLRRQLWAWADSRDYQAISDWLLHPASGYTLQPGTLFNQGGGGDPLIAHITTASISSDVSIGIFTAKPGVRWDTPNTPAVDLGTSLHSVSLAGHQAWQGGPDSNRQFDAWWSYGPLSIIISGPSQARADAMMTVIVKVLT